MAKRRIPLTAPEQERQFLDAFVELLERDETARVSWICALRAATRGTPYDIQIPAADRPRVEANESRRQSESGSYLFALLTGLRLCPPDFWVPVKNDLDLQTWLRDTVIAYRAGRYTNPFQPWEPKGRPRRDLEATVEMVLGLMRACYAENREPSQAYVGKLFGEELSADTDFRSTTRYLLRNGYPWSRLKVMARARQEKN